jgi:hypothetical protein
MHGTLHFQQIKIKLTYGSLFLGSSVPNSLIRSLMLKRRRLSTESKLVLSMQNGQFLDLAAALCHAC